MFRIIVLFLGALALFSESTGAAEDPEGLAPVSALRPIARTDVSITARWDHLPAGAAWTRASVAALRTHASNLPDIVPRDIGTWCPAYPSASRERREAFWVGLVSTLAKHESTWRPTAVGGGGLWYGLLQILPSTAEYRKCRAQTPGQLKNGPANLSCGFRIMAITVDRDRVVSYGMRGVAADWGPFHSRRKRTDMINWMRDQDYCKGLSASLRPVARPMITPIVGQAIKTPHAFLAPAPDQPIGPQALADITP